MRALFLESRCQGKLHNCYALKGKGVDCYKGLGHLVQIGMVLLSGCLVKDEVVKFSSRISLGEGPLVRN